MPPAPRPPRPPRHKSVTFCTRCNQDDNTYKYTSDIDVRYYSDPGNNPRDGTPKLKKKEPIAASTDSDLRYYSEPDAKSYFEIDYAFLKELRKIARNNCPKCKRKRTRKATADPRERPPRSSRLRENFVFCNGRYHSDKEHCQLCCRVCNKSTDTLDSLDEDQYSLVSRSYSQPSKATTSSYKSSRSTDSRSKSSKSRERKNSVQSNKSVSFLESSNDESIKDEPNYTAKSFTNDLKKFLLKPSTPKLSLRDKFMISLKQEFDKKKSPKLKAIKGLWKSY